MSPVQQREIKEHLVAASDRVGAILALLSEQELLGVDDGLLVQVLADLNLELWRARWAFDIGTGHAQLRVEGAES